MADYYGDSDEGKMDSKPEMDGSDSSAEEKDEGTTALLPKSILAGKEFKPGEEVVLKIVEIYDDEVEVAYATGKKEEPQSKSARETSDDQLTMLGKEE